MSIMLGICRITDAQVKYYEKLRRLHRQEEMKKIMIEMTIIKEIKTPQSHLFQTVSFGNTPESATPPPLCVSGTPTYMDMFQTTIDTDTTLVESKVEIE